MSATIENPTETLQPNPETAAADAEAQLKQDILAGSMRYLGEAHKLGSGHPLTRMSQELAAAYRGMYGDDFKVGAFTRDPQTREVVEGQGNGMWVSNAAAEAHKSQQ